MFEDSVIVHQLVKRRTSGSCQRRARRSIIRWARSAIVQIPDVSLQIAESAEVLPASCTLMHCDVHRLDTWSELMNCAICSVFILFFWGHVTVVAYRVKRV